MIKAFAPHKVILTGEHAVVYGVPSVATSLDLKTYVLIEKSNKDVASVSSECLGKTWVLSDSPPKNFEFMSRIFQILQDHYLDGEEIPSFEITVKSDVNAGCGLGTSASTAVALTGALFEALDLDVDRDEINSIAYEAEKVTHGTPSGIDNTIATFGSILAYSPGKQEEIKLMDEPPKFSLILLDSGQERSTRKAVEAVRGLYEEKKQMVENVFQEIWKISEDVWFELKGTTNWEKIGRLLSKNHRLLQKIEVSTPMLDRLVNIANKSGALGSKLTGAGLGGYVIALPPQGKAEVVKERIKRKVGSGVSIVKNSLSGLTVTGGFNE